MTPALLAIWLGGLSRLDGGERRSHSCATVIDNGCVEYAYRLMTIARLDLDSEFERRQKAEPNG
jgi:hypothetical protein